MRFIETRVTRLENARALIEPADPALASADLWRRFEALEARLIAAGDDLQHKAKDSPATNAVRAMMRGDMEAAVITIHECVKPISTVV
ncbi:MAG: hypothetical protein ACFE0P_08025 [Oceanicaulis sp.]